ncbi:hypothetical protein [Endothiovibrio diazotrophicus]
MTFDVTPGARCVVRPVWGGPDFTVEWWWTHRRGAISDRRPPFLIAEIYKPLWAIPYIAYMALMAGWLFFKKTF